MAPDQIVEQINRDLDFNRLAKTAINRREPDEEIKIDFVDSKTPKLGTERKVSDTSTPHDMFKFKLKDSQRKGTQDESMIRKTGYFANPDSDAYQSHIHGVLAEESEEIVRVDEIEKGDDTMDLFLSGLRIVIINEDGATYYPVMDINITEVHFERKDLSTKSSAGQTATYIS